MPNSAGHVKFVMPPIGSIGSGQASYRDLTRTLTDEKGTLYSALSAIVLMVTAVTRKNFDKVTFEATKISSIFQFFNLVISLAEPGRFFANATQVGANWAGGWRISKGCSSDVFSCMFVCVIYNLF
jgi:hypothetical protein